MIKISKVPKEGYKYIPLSERDQENPFSVMVKPLTSKQLMTLEDKVVRRDGQELTFSSGEFSFNVCKLTIISWENIEDSDGQPLVIKLNSEATVTDLSLGYIPSEIITEIANVVTSVSRDPGKAQIYFGTEETEKPTKK